MYDKESIRRQMRQAVDNYYSFNGEYGNDGLGIEAQHELAIADLKSWWSLKGPVPPLIWDALGSTTKKRIADGHDVKIRGKLVIIGISSIFELFLWIATPLPLILIFGYLGIIMLFATLAYADEHMNPWLDMKPPSKRMYRRSLKRVTSYTNSKREPGMLSISSEPVGGELTITKPLVGGLEVMDEVL